MAGIETTPEKNNAHKIGRLKPDRHAKAKNGRNPTSHSGCADNFISPPCYRFLQTIRCVRTMNNLGSSHITSICALKLIETFDHFPFTNNQTTPQQVARYRVGWIKRHRRVSTIFLVDSRYALNPPYKNIVPQAAENPPKSQIKDIISSKKRGARVLARRVSRFYVI